MKEKKTRKDKYVTPEMEVVRFERSDVIVTSGASEPDNDIGYGDFS